MELGLITPVNNPAISNMAQTFDSSSADLISTMEGTTENNEKGLRLEKAETKAETKSIAENERQSVLVIYNSAVTSCFGLPVVALCVAFVAALGMNWSSVKEKQKEGDEEEKKEKKKETGSEGEPLA